MAEVLRYALVFKFLLISR